MPPPGCSDPKYFVLGSCLPLARARLFFFVSLEIIFFWVLFLQHLFFSDWLLYFFGIYFFLLVCTNRELQGRSITPSRFLFWIQQVSQFFCMCLRCTNQKFHEIDQKLNVFTSFLDSMCFRGKRIVSISPWSWTGGRISSWSAASR